VKGEFTTETQRAQWGGEKRVYYWIRRGVEVAVSSQQSAIRGLKKIENLGAKDLH